MHFCICYAILDVTNIEVAPSKRILCLDAIPRISCCLTRRQN
nr:MAG TPA: hypothetical protein [Caudoviricetes sp.]